MDFFALGRLAMRFCCNDELLAKQVGKQLVDDTLPIEQDAHRLSKSLGVSLAAMREALPGLNRCLARRLPGRRVYKPLDLSVLTTFVRAADGEELGTGESLPDDVEAELIRLSPMARDEVEAMLRRLHLCGGAFPKIGLGMGGLHKVLPSEEHAPAARAYEHGCRLFPSTDPFVGTPFEDMHDYSSIASELQTKDLSSAVYMGMVNPVGLGKRGEEGVFASVALHRERLVATGCTSLHGHIGRQEARGGDHGPQPFLDCLTTMAVVGIGPGMSPDPSLQLDVVWRAMEELVFDGTVRAIGICNVTLLQLEGLLETCRIRPACVHIEHHPWVGCGALDAFVELALNRRVSVIAHTPLAQGSHLDEDDRLAKLPSGLTPAQATLRFSLDRGLSVLPGALTLAHVVENLGTPLHVPSPELPPLESGVVSAWPLNINPQWQPYISISGGGALRHDIDGHVHAVVLSEAERVGAIAKALQVVVEEQPHAAGKAGEGASPHKLAKVSVKHASMFAQLTPIIEMLPRKASALERRTAIGAALAALEEGKSSQAGVVEGGSPLAAKERLAASRAEGGEHLLAQMQVIRYDDFVSHGSVPRRSCHDESSMHMSITELPDDAKVIFISQRWLRREHPDDEQGSKHRCLRVAAARWAAHEGIELSKDDFSELFRCVNALGLYVACSDCFIAFEHPEYWARAWCLAEQMFGDAVRLPRFVLRLDGETLEPIDTGKVLRQQLVDPSTGQLTVENDRVVIEVLKHVATHIRARLWFGWGTKQMSLMMLEMAFADVDDTQSRDAPIGGTHGVSV